MEAVAVGPPVTAGWFGLATRIAARCVTAWAIAFLVDTYFTIGLGWPGGGAPFRDGAAGIGWLQFLLYPVLAGLVAADALRRPEEPLRADEERLSAIVAFVIRASFWAVLIVGVSDMIISFLRVEEFLPLIFSEETARSFGVPNWRGTHVHLPLMAISVLIALRSRTLGFTWLAVLVVVAEFTIVIARFIFSYEQAFMGDLVRFWYAALFLFASAQTLVEEGHVRVDVLYAGFSERRKAWVNYYGCILLGAPLCWVILILGLRDKASIIASPILSFETTQAGFGLYVKYMMAGFLGVFGLSMLIQFCAYLVGSAADLRGEPRPARLESAVVDH